MAAAPRSSRRRRAEALVRSRPALARRRLRRTDGRDGGRPRPLGGGERFARTLARELAEAGVTVISGLALGIDAAAHAGALDGAGRTIAVLGCGIDRDYPRPNAALAKRIASAGAIVSEWGPGVEPAPWRFPVRNRIVATLAQATVVVEATRRSGR